MNGSATPFRARPQIEGEAEATLKKLDLFKIPIDPIRVAHLLDIRIFNATFDDDSISGILTRRGPNVTMLINANDSAYRKRFTIAHELGHRLLKHYEDVGEHTDWSRDLYRTTSCDGPDLESDQRQEIQANLFAAALLMPSTLVREQFKLTPDVDDMARIFQVSVDAMGNRLNTLGLL